MFTAGICLSCHQLTQVIPVRRRWLFGTPYGWCATCELDLREAQERHPAHRRKPDKPA